MESVVNPVTKLEGSVCVPGDKSISHRAIMLGSLSKGTTRIHGFLMGEDCLSTVSCFRKLGISIHIGSEAVEVKGNGLWGLRAPSDILDSGNSGTTSRILLGILAGQRFDSAITGDPSLCRRPMDRVVRPLTLMGANIHGVHDDNYLPLIIKGQPLKGISYTLPVASAQVKSSLIMAALFSQGTTRITEPIPCRNHTELMLRSFGGNIAYDKNTIIIEPVSELHAQEVHIPGDISSAAFLMTAALILPGSELCIQNVGLNESRTGIIDVYRQMGGNIKIENKREQNGEPVGDLVITSSSLKGTIISGNMIPRLIDEIPVITVAAAYAQGTTIIKDAQELKMKESNRIDAMAKELSKMGARIQATPDGMIIEGGYPLRGAAVDNYHDHRIAMAMTIAALAAKGESTIKGYEYIKISFPRFDTILSEVSRK